MRRYFKGYRDRDVEYNRRRLVADYLFGDGALIGYNKLSGILPGGDEYAGYITYQVYAENN